MAHLSNVCPVCLKTTWRHVRTIESACMLPNRRAGEAVSYRIPHRVHRDRAQEAGRRFEEH
eukprot:303504-Rhodomonas_salina.6